MDRVSASGAEERSSSLRGGARDDRRKAVFVLDYNPCVSKKLFTIALAALILSGCKFQVDVIEPPTPSAVIVTSTLPSSLTPPPSETALPPPATSTVVPVEAVASTQVNVRAEPNSASEVLGVLIPNSRVEVIGKDPSGHWWLIQYPPGPNGNAWVASEFVKLSQDGEVPVVEGNELNPNNGVFGLILEQVNVRSGPGTSFNSLGTLKANDSVTVVGKDSSGAWLQILFESGTDGKGWISATFIKANDVHLLPVVTDSGLVIGTSTPATDNAPSPAPTILPAPADNDSAVAPAVNVTLTYAGTRSFQYSSDVSSPAGDAEDWIQFKTFTPTTLVELRCEGSESYVAELLQNNSKMQNLVCGKIILVSTDPNAVYAVHFVSSPTGGLVYTKYTLRVEAMP